MLMARMSEVLAALALATVASGSGAQAPGGEAPNTPAPAPAAAAPTPAPIPLEAFARLPLMEAPELSPDGSHIAAKMSVNGKQRLVVLSLTDQTASWATELGDVDLNDWTWVNDQWLVASVGATSDVEGNDWYLRRLLRVEIATHKTSYIAASDAAQNAADVIWVARDGSPRLLLSMQTSIFANDIGLWPEVRSVDVSTGRSTIAVPSRTNVGSWGADGTGLVRVGIARDDVRRTHNLLYRDRQGQTWRTIERVKGIMQDLALVPALFLPEPDKAIAYDDDEGGFTSLYPLDISTLKRGEKMFGVPGYDIGSMITNATGDGLLGVRYTDTRSRTHWFDPKLADIQAEIDKSVGSRAAHIVSWNRDFRRLIVYVAPNNKPGAFYFFDVAGGFMQIMSSINDQIKGPTGAVSTITYKARDGLEIPAVLTLPPGRAAKGLPLILMPHGGPFARDEESWDWWAQFLASRGYAVLQPNYRGSSGYGTEFTKKGEGQWGLAMQDDLTDAVAWATAQGIADAKRVCIVGGSYGGYAAFRAAQRDTGVYRCAVSFAGVSDMPAMVRYDGQFLNGGFAKDYRRAQAPDLAGISPINHAAEFGIPILIMHGKADKVVPVKQSRTMVAKLKALGKPYVYVEQPLGDHHLSIEADRVQFLKEMDAFLKQHNPA